MGFTEEIHRGNLDQMCLNIINKYPFLTVYSWTTEPPERDGVEIGNTSVVLEQKSLSLSLSLTHTHTHTHTHTRVYISPLEIYNYTALTQKSVMCSYRQREISKCYKRRRGRKIENKGTGVKKEVCGLGSESLSIQGSSVDQIHGRLMSVNITGP